MNYIYWIFIAIAICILTIKYYYIFKIRGKDSRVEDPEWVARMKARADRERILQEQKDMENLRVNEEREAKALSDELRWSKLDKMSYKEIQEVRDELDRRTLKPAISFEARYTKDLDLCTSKIGGTPYIPKDGQTPIDADGRQLRLIAQINLSELPDNTILPNKGVLQFFAINNNMFGIAPYLNNVNKTNQVVYYESIDKSVTNGDVLEKYIPWIEAEDKDFFPVQGEFSLEFELVSESMQSNDSRFEGLFCEVWNEKYPDLPIVEIGELPHQDTALDMDYTCFSKIGGYPIYSQYEPIGIPGNLLFELQSTLRDELIDGRIQIGDGGILHFFVEEEDLSACEFENAVYHWDCS